MAFLRVLHLDLGREWRGGQRQVFLLARHLHRGRHDVRVAAPRSAPLLERCAEAGIPVLALGGHREWSPSAFLGLRRILADDPPAILHTHDARSAALGALLKVLGPVRFKLVHTRRVSYQVSGWWSVEKYRLGDAVAAVSGEIADVLAACGVDQDKLHVIHSGIDPTGYALRRPHDPPLRIGLIGALTAQKGVEVFLKALALLRGRVLRPAWRAVVVGSGPLEQELKKQATELGLTGASGLVEFTGWRESREVLPDLDILAVPSVSGEGSSGAVKEAWVSGVPVVVSALPSNLELVEPEESGLAVAVGDAEGLAEGLTRLLLDQGLREQLAAGGTRRVAAFTDTAMGQAYEALYARLTSAVRFPGPPPQFPGKFPEKSSGTSSDRKLRSFSKE